MVVDQSPPFFTISESMGPGVHTENLVYDIQCHEHKDDMKIVTTKYRSFYGLQSKFYTTILAKD